MSRPIIWQVDWDMELTRTKELEPGGKEDERAS